jgi:hypothetical protein
MLVRAEARVISGSAIEGRDSHYYGGYEEATMGSGPAARDLRGATRPAAYVAGQAAAAASEGESKRVRRHARCCLLNSP